MFWTAETQRDWIKTVRFSLLSSPSFSPIYSFFQDLGPTLAENGHGDIKVMILDDQRYLVSNWASTILGDPDANKYVSGTGVHWFVRAWVSFRSQLH